MANKFTVTDLLKLKRILETGTIEFFLGQHHFDDFDAMLLDLKKTIQQVPNCEDVVETKLKHWIRNTFADYKVHPINKFIFEMPLEEAPLNVNDAFLGPFAIWRLQVAK